MCVFLRTRARAASQCARARVHVVTSPPPHTTPPLNASTPERLREDLWPAHPISTLQNIELPSEFLEAEGKLTHPAIASFLRRTKEKEGKITRADVRHAQDLLGRLSRLVPDVSRSTGARAWTYHGSPGMVGHRSQRGRSDYEASSLCRTGPLSWK